MSAARDHITDILGQRVEVGDRVAAAVTGWRTSSLVVGRVEKLTATRTTVRLEKRTGYAYGDVSVVDDSLGRIVKLPAEVTE
ncbi:MULTISPECIES: hypothetical protein [unclassified Microbacterium]|uniref:hypothetical protein n=1 Tax=unclassified Microbacterium TaxID=2609290 RepID=UPI0004184124|nr:hypothetical protein [Microbacterium sp. B24]